LVPGIVGIRGAGLGKAGVEALVELAELEALPLTPLVVVGVDFLTPHEARGDLEGVFGLEDPPPKEGKSPSDRILGGVLGFLRCLGDVDDEEGVST
jgi:hypothetical protein